MNNLRPNHPDAILSVDAPVGRGIMVPFIEIRKVALVESIVVLSVLTGDAAGQLNEIYLNKEQMHVLGKALADIPARESSDQSASQMRESSRSGNLAADLRNAAAMKPSDKEGIDPRLIAVFEGLAALMNGAADHIEKLEAELGRDLT